MRRSAGKAISHAIATIFPIVTPKIAAGNAKKNGIRKIPTIHPAAPRAVSAVPDEWQTEDQQENETGRIEAAGSR